MYKYQYLYIFSNVFLLIACIIPFDTYITPFGATESLFVAPSPYDDPLVFGLSTLPSS